MKNRNYLLAAISALSLMTLGTIAGSARAQDATTAAAPTGKVKKAGKGGAKGGAAGSPVAVAFKAVDPTADESAKFDVIDAKFKSDISALAISTTDPKERRMQTTSLNQKFRADTEALLTSDQAAKFKDEYALASIMPHFRQLMLTPEEVAKIKPAIMATAGQIAAVQDDTSLKGKDKRAKLEDLYTSIKAEVKPLLTTDQQTQLETMSLPPQGGRRAAATAVAAPPAAPAPPAP